MNEMPPAVAQTSENRRVLLIDADPVNQLIVLERLDEAACWVDVADGAGQLAGNFSSGGWPLVFINLARGVADLLQDMQQLRALPGCGGVPVIALVDPLAPDEAASALAMGACAVLNRPLDADALANSLQRWLGSDDASAFDATVLLRQLNGSRSLAKAVLASMLKNAPECLCHMVAAQAAAQWSLAATQAHRLSALVGQGGGVRMAALARSHEIALRNGGTLTAAAMQALRDEFGRLERCARQWLDDE